MKKIKHDWVLKKESKIPGARNKEETEGKRMTVVLEGGWEGIGSVN